MHHLNSGNDDRPQRGWHGRGHRLLKVAIVLTLMVAVAGVLGWIVLSLWNWLMPAVFGLGTVTFWQALGLLVLARILIGGMRGFRHGGRRHHRHMRERWERMTAEERESFSRGLRNHCPWRGRGGDSIDAGPGTQTQGHPAP